MGKKAERNQARYKYQSELERAKAIAAARLRKIKRLQDRSRWFDDPPGSEPHFVQGGLPGLGKRR